MALTVIDCISTNCYWCQFSTSVIVCRCHLDLNGEIFTYVFIISVECRYNIVYTEKSGQKMMYMF